MQRRKKSDEWLSGAKASTYATVKVPVAFAERIDSFLQENPGLGLVSRADFVKEASNEFMGNYGTSKRTKE